ncbi:MAG: tetratricopeptide repeat protein [Saprospiraceae bacterium]|nr:tetratricopeptide repeat protein [Saprospiraceae bacterium]
MKVGYLMVRFYLVFLILIELLPKAGSQDLVRKAAELYQKGQYSESEKIWTELIQEGYRNAEIYFNLANCQFQQRKLAESILHYQKAIAQKPSLEMAKVYLLKAQRMADVEPVIDKKWKLLDWFDDLCLSLSSMVWLFLTVFVFGLFLFSSWISPNRILRIASIFLTILWLSFLFRQEWIKSDYRKRCVVMESVPARLSADENSKSEGQVSAGETVYCTETIGDWVKIQNGLFGNFWVKKQVLHCISARQD